MVAVPPGVPWGLAGRTATTPPRPPRPPRPRPLLAHWTA
nr:MAG TPA: hypothetical protein [Caudoviricetes sp.]